MDLEIIMYFLQKPTKKENRSRSDLDKAEVKKIQVNTPFTEHCCYRPQRSCGKVNFHRRLSVILFTGRVSASVHGGIPPPSRAGTPSWAGTPAGSYTPQTGTPPEAHPPPDGHCSGRYASYWNAFLLNLIFKMNKQSY